MRKSDIAYIISCAFLAIYSLSYCATIWLHLKVPRYYPLQHTWKMVKEEGVPSQGWYGMTGFAFVASCVITFLLYLLMRSAGAREGMLTPRRVKLVGAISILVLIGCMVYVALYEFLKWGVF